MKQVETRVGSEAAAIRRNPESASRESLALRR
jgi:hypothetical protein